MGIGDWTSPRAVESEFLPLPASRAGTPRTEALTWTRHLFEESGSPVWISDPSCHLAEQRIVGVVEGEQEGGAMTAPAEGPAKEWPAEAL